MSETSPFIEREIKADLPYPVKSPEFSSRYLMEGLKIAINDAQARGEDVTEDQKRQERFEAMYKELQIPTDYKQGADIKGEEFRDLVLGHIKKTQADAKEKGDSLLAAQLEGDYYFVESKFNLINSFKDSLTGLYNRRGLVNTLIFIMQHQEEFFGKDDEKMAGKKVAIIMTDVDNFGSFNKKFGEDTGDDVLKTCAQAMEDGVREGDLVGRWGGEENVIIAFGADPQLIDARMSRNLSDLSEEYKSQGHPVTFSSGAVSVEWEYLRAVLNGEVTLDANKDKVFGEPRTLHSEEMEGLFYELVLKDADNQMRSAKKEGKNQISVGEDLGRGAGN